MSTSFTRFMRSMRSMRSKRSKRSDTTQLLSREVSVTVNHISSKGPPF